MRKTLTIAITGEAGSGKSTMAAFIRRQMEDREIEAKVVSLSGADILEIQMDSRDREMLGSAF